MQNDFSENQRNWIPKIQEKHVRTTQIHMVTSEGVWTDTNLMDGDSFGSLYIEQQ